MKITFLLIFNIFCAEALFAQFNYLPAPIPGHQVISYTQFTLSYNEGHEQPEWVAYELDSTEAKMEAGRCNCFSKDDNVLTGSATPADYSNSGFDKGHLSPSEDNQLSAANNRESFLMSNMSPQLHRFNNGKWKELESWVRDKAMEFDSIYVVSGPVFLNNLGTIGADSVTIPGYFYKIVLRFENNSPKIIAFLIPQVAAIGELKDYVVPVNALESITGIDFFPALPDSVENKAESTEILSQWGL